MSRSCWYRSVVLVVTDGFARLGRILVKGRASKEMVLVEDSPEKKVHRERLKTTVVTLDLGDGEIADIAAYRGMHATATEYRYSIGTVPEMSIVSQQRHLPPHAQEHRRIPRPVLPQPLRGQNGRSQHTGTGELAARWWTVKQRRGPGHGLEPECEVRRLYAGIESAWRWCRTHETYVGVCRRTGCGERYHAQRRRPGYCSGACRQTAYRVRLLRLCV